MDAPKRPSRKAIDTTLSELRAMARMYRAWQQSALKAALDPGFTERWTVIAKRHERKAERIEATVAWIETL